MSTPSQDLSENTSGTSLTLGIQFSDFVFDTHIEVSMPPFGKWPEPPRGAGLACAEQVCIVVNPKVEI